MFVGEVVEAGVRSEDTAVLMKDHNLNYDHSSTQRGGPAQAQAGKTDEVAVHLPVE